MANWHGYIGIEDLNMTDPQKQQLWDVLKARGQANGGPLPHLRNHWRISLAGDKIIFEALFDEAQLTVVQFKIWLGNIFSVDPATISHSTVQQVFGTLETPIVTFIHGGTNYIRFAGFGGVGATWEESRKEVLAYMSANLIEWEEEV